MLAHSFSFLTNLVQNTFGVLLKMFHQPAYYQPVPASVYNNKPSAPFTSFAEVNGKFTEVNNNNNKNNNDDEQAPVAAVIETAGEKGGDDDGEVGQIFF